MLKIQWKVIKTVSPLSIDQENQDYPHVLSTLHTCFNSCKEGRRVSIRRGKGNIPWRI
jgi:hypothetical protein